MASDGFTVDETKPEGGYVVDGSDLSTDLVFASSHLRVQASWAGFYDPEDHKEGKPLHYKVGISPCAVDIDDVRSR